MKRKKLLYVGNALSPSGRTLTHIETLSGLLQNEGYEVIVTSSRLRKVTRMLDMVRSFFKNRREIDVVLIDTYSTTNFWYAVIIANLCRQYKVDYIPILHGGNLPDRLSKNSKVCKQLFGGAVINVAPSEYLYSAFAKAGFTNLKCIPNTIELKNYPFKERRNIAPKLLWVRAFAEIYNPEMALTVLKQLLKTYPSAALTMIGPDKDGSLERCRAIAEQENLIVEFTGKLDKSEWINRSKEFDIFINTTNFDNTPVSLIEAMALGLPIVSADVGGIPFLIEDGENGLLCPPENVVLFTEQIIRLLENNDLGTSISNRARLKVEQFDWTLVKDLWHEVLY